MEWAEKYLSDRQPTANEISSFISNPMWEDINEFLQTNYEIEPKYSYSVCSGQPGWNIKYQKAGRSLCTLYPMNGFFIALVVLGNKEEAKAAFVIPTCDEDIQHMYSNTVALMGGRWLMINVTTEKKLDDVKKLIQLRRKIKRRD